MLQSMSFVQYSRKGKEHVTYPGGKSGAGVFQTIINLMPPHDIYVEPFLGGGAVMRLKRPAAVNVGVDRDRAALESVVLPLPAVAAATGRPSEAHLLDIWAWRRSSVPEWGPPSLLDPIAIPAGGGPAFELRVGDGIEFLRVLELPSSALVYCDPPYLRSTRATRKDLYQFEMTDAQHLELLSVIKTLKCRVMISGYSSTLYARELKTWNACAFQAATRGKPAAEWVWCNYPRPVELHDYRYLGSNYREREQIKRMKARWIGKLERMPALKRQALLAAIAATG